MRKNGNKKNRFTDLSSAAHRSRIEKLLKQNALDAEGGIRVAMQLPKMLRVVVPLQ